MTAKSARVEAMRPDRSTEGGRGEFARLRPNSDHLRRQLSARPSNSGLQRLHCREPIRCGSRGKTRPQQVLATAAETGRYCVPITRYIVTRALFPRSAVRLRRPAERWARNGSNGRAPRTSQRTGRQLRQTLPTTPHRSSPVLSGHRTP